MNQRLLLEAKTVNMDNVRHRKYCSSLTAIPESPEEQSLGILTSESIFLNINYFFQKF